MRYKYELGFFGNLERSLKEITKTNKVVEENTRVVSVQLEQADETAISLYEAQAEQEAINAAQDEALIEIYEMMEG